jgi:hypothetical protein
MTTTHPNPASRKVPSRGIGQPVADLPVLFRVPKVGVTPGAKPAPVDVTPKGPEKETVLPPVAEKKTAVAEVAAKKEVAAESTTPAAPTPTPTPTPAARTKPKTKESGGWFDNQGKLITVCFLVALAATIYFARSKRQESDPQPIADVPLEVAVPTASNSDEKPKDNWQAPDELNLPRKRPAARDVEIARKRAEEGAKAAENADKAPRADLLPPMDLSAPPLVQKPKESTDKPPVAPNDPATATPQPEPRVADAPTDRRGSRSSWGIGESPAPGASTEAAPPNGYPAPAPANAPPSAPAAPAEAAPMYPTTPAAPYRYYMPPSSQPGATFQR